MDLFLLFVFLQPGPVPDILVACAGRQRGLLHRTPGYTGVHQSTGVGRVPEGLGYFP